MAYGLARAVALVRRGAITVDHLSGGDGVIATDNAAEAAAFERLHGQYEMNDVFYKDWSKRLIGPQSAAAYKGAEAGLAASGQKHYQQEMADYKRDSAAQQAADKQIYGTQGLSNDPTAVATRRCL